MVERLTVNQGVAGSNPAVGAMTETAKFCRYANCVFHFLNKSFIYSLAEQGNPADREDCDNVNGVNDPVRIFTEIRKVLCFA